MINCKSKSNRKCKNDYFADACDSIIMLSHIIIFCKRFASRSLREELWISPFPPSRVQKKFAKMFFFNLNIMTIKKPSLLDNARKTPLFSTLVQTRGLYHKRNITRKFITCIHLWQLLI